MSLTSAEKAAGRVFRDYWLALLAAQPSAARCSGFIREYRHSCPRARGVSVAIRMREHVTLSPEYLARKERGEWKAWPESEAPAGLVFAGVPAGLFAFAWLDGKCACGLRVRSAGRVVLAAQLEGGEARETSP